VDFNTNIASGVYQSSKSQSVKYHYRLTLKQLRIISKWQVIM